ncbi:uncharacterized protein LOC104265904 [Ciona intestinalis]
MRSWLIEICIICYLESLSVNTVSISLPAPGNKTTKALGISNLKISTTISTTGVYYCGWRYGGEFDVSSFYIGAFVRCYNYTGVNETITCVNNTGTVTSQLTLLQPQYKDLNINMQCSPSPSYSVNITLKQCITTNQVNVTSSKSEYNSVGSVSCSSGSELFYKVNGSLVVDRTTTCNAYAEWTNINNMLCSNGPSKTVITGNYSLPYGKKANLMCEYTGESPAANFSKFYFDQIVNEVNKSSIWKSPPLQASDNNKVVECQAVNQYTNYFNQSHRANITLNVTYPPQTVKTHITQSNILVKHDGGYLMQSDQVLIMNCSANANPPPNYRWKICSISNNCTTRNGNIYNGSGATLNTNTSSMICIAQNFLGDTASKTINLTVVSTNRSVNIRTKPNTKYLNESRLETNLTDNITVTCNVDHQNQLNTTHTWRLPNGTTIIKQTLEFQSLAPTDTGNYTCVTNDVFGNFSNSIYIDVIYPPMTENHTIVCKCILGSNDGCNITYSSNPPVDSAILTNETGEVIDNSSLCFETCQSELQSYKFCKLGISGNFTLKLKSTTFPDKELIINITATGVTKAPPPSTNMTIIIAIAAASSCFLIIIIIATVVFYVKRRRSKKDKKDVVNPSPGSRDIHTETGGVGENQSFPNPAFENEAENSGLVTKSKKKQEYAVAQKGKKKKKTAKGTPDEKEIKDNPLYVAGSPDQVEDAYAEVNKKGKNIKEEKVNPLYATTQASGQTSGDYATVDLKKKKGKGITKKEEKVNPLYVSSDQPDKVEDAYAEVDKKKNKKKIGKGEKEEKANPLYVSSDQPDKVEDSYAEVDKKKNKKAKAKTGKADKKGNSQQASSSMNGGYEEVDLNKKKKKENPTKEEKVNPLYVSSDQPDKVEDAYAEVDRKKNKKKIATKPDKEEKVNPLYVSSDQPSKVEDAYAEVDKKKNKKKPIKATPTKDQPSTSKNETYTEVKKLKKKPLNQNNNENTQQAQGYTYDATYYSVVLHGSHEKDKDKLDKTEDSEQE